MERIGISSQQHTSSQSEVASSTTYSVLDEKQRIHDRSRSLRARKKETPSLRSSGIPIASSTTTSVLDEKQRFAERSRRVRASNQAIITDRSIEGERPGEVDEIQCMTPGAVAIPGNSQSSNLSDDESTLSQDPALVNQESTPQTVVTATIVDEDEQNRLREAEDNGRQSVLRNAVQAEAYVIQDVCGKRSRRMCAGAVLLVAMIAAAVITPAVMVTRDDNGNPEHDVEAVVNTTIFVVPEGESIVCREATDVCTAPASCAVFSILESEGATTEDTNGVGDSGGGNFFSNGAYTWSLKGDCEISCQHTGCACANDANMCLSFTSSNTTIQTTSESSTPSCRFRAHHSREICGLLLEGIPEGCDCYNFCGDQLENCIAFDKGGIVGFCDGQDTEVYGCTNDDRLSASTDSPSALPPESGAMSAHVAAILTSMLAGFSSFM
jgi:hypothetical protein